MFTKVLVANRGEIAVRILRACHELGIRAVVAYSEADRDSLAVRLADEAICIGPPQSAKSYLNTPNVIEAALITGCQAIHPGYGFLSEDPYVAEICERCGLTFVGPRQDVIERMSDKALARALMADAGLPVLPGSEGPIPSVESALEAAAAIGYPVLLKPVYGGGGRGMRLAHGALELTAAYPLAIAEAEAAFGRGELYLEKYIPHARHIEVQVLGDNYGHVIHAGERECSVQRRHQKVIEEAPAPNLPPDVRSRLTGDAAAGARGLGYTSAGTLEFLLDEQGRYYFIEMNTRIQVEHPVTEMITGLDLVKWQFRIAAGEALTVAQAEVAPLGHAIECRVNAEDAALGFRPQAGAVARYLPPGGPGVRVDSHLFPGYHIPPYYDSLLAKVIAHGNDRGEAIQRMRRALAEMAIEGIPTTIPLHQRVLETPEFIAGRLSTQFLAEFAVEAPLVVGA
jgi:acetyl-CoA carboxylase biotin carboxylase subunit